MPPRRLALSFLLLLGLLAPAAAPPTPPGSAPVEEVPGWLLVGGGGKVSELAQRRFVDLAGGPRARLVVISSGDVSRSADDWKALGAASVVVRTASDPALARSLADATAAWLEGDAARLAALRGTAIGRALRALLARGGAVGAPDGLALGEVMVSGRAARPTLSRGLGLLPGVAVEPHFLARNRVDRLQAALARRPGLAGLGVDEGSAVLVRGRRLGVLGPSYAAVCLAAGPGRPASTRVLRAGQVADLFSLRRSALIRSGPAFPPKRPAPPEVRRGALLIGGGGGMALSIWRRFVDLAGGPDALIVVVPTALEDPLPLVPGEVKALRKAGARNVRVLHTRDRSKANDPAFVALLEKAGGVWFSGGRQWRFVDAYEDTAAERAFHAVLARGGAIGGSSAGASIQSEYMPRGDPLGNLNIIAEGYERGFGFLPGVAIDQHFFARRRTADMSQLMGAYPQLLGIGIDEGTALIVRGSVMEVVGRSRVAVYDRRRPAGRDKDYEELRAGDRYDLKARRKLAR
jgi:cyanophycinase